MTNVEIQMSKEIQKPKDESDRDERRFDLEERTAVFGERAIAFVKKLPLTPITESLICQFVRAATSVGANFCEADDAGSRKEFSYRISICKRESRETKHWLRMIAAAVPEAKGELREIWSEARELNLIFAAIHNRVRTNGANRKRE